MNNLLQGKHRRTTLATLNNDYEKFKKAEAGVKSIAESFQAMPIIFQNKLKAAIDDLENSAKKSVNSAESLDNLFDNDFTKLLLQQSSSGPTYSNILRNLANIFSSKSNDIDSSRNQNIRDYLFKFHQPKKMFSNIDFLHDYYTLNSDKKADHFKLSAALIKHLVDFKTEFFDSSVVEDITAYTKDKLSRYVEDLISKPLASNSEMNKAKVALLDGFFKFYASSDFLVMDEQDKNLSIKVLKYLNANFEKLNNIEYFTDSDSFSRNLEKTLEKLINSDFENKLSKENFLEIASLVTKGIDADLKDGDSQIFPAVVVIDKKEAETRSKVTDSFKWIRKFIDSYNFDLNNHEQATINKLKMSMVNNYSHIPQSSLYKILFPNLPGNKVHHLLEYDTNVLDFVEESYSQYFDDIKSHVRNSRVENDEELLKVFENMSSKLIYNIDYMGDEALNQFHQHEEFLNQIKTLNNIFSDLSEKDFHTPTARYGLDGLDTLQDILKQSDNAPDNEIDQPEDIRTDIQNSQPVMIEERVLENLNRAYVEKFL